VSLQYNMGAGKPMYSPSRDIAYLYPELVATIEQRLYEGPFEPLKKLLEHNHITEDNLAEAIRVYCEFLNSAHKTPDQSVEQCLEASGWFAQDPLVRIAVMFYMGAAMTGSVFGAIRDTTRMGEEPPHIRTLTAAGERMARYMNAGWFRRVYLRVRARWLTSVRLTFRPPVDV